MAVSNDDIYKVLGEIRDALDGVAVASVLNSGGSRRSRHAGSTMGDYGDGSFTQERKDEELARIEKEQLKNNKEVGIGKRSLGAAEKKVEGAEIRLKNATTEEEKKRAAAALKVAKVERKHKEAELDSLMMQQRVLAKNKKLIEEAEVKSTGFGESIKSWFKSDTKLGKQYESDKKKYKRQGYSEGQASRKAKVNARAAAIGAAANIGGNLINSLADNKKEVSIADIGGKLANVASKFGAIGGAIGGIINLITAAIVAYDKINIASSKYARSVGGGSAKMKQMKNDSVKLASSLSDGARKAYNFESILEDMQKVSEKTGRIMDKMSKMDVRSMEDLLQFGIDADTINQFETFGINVENIDKRILDIQKAAGRHGLNAKVVTDTVAKNLKLAQSYTFAGGLRSLTRMAEKAVALKYNLEAATKFADKVSTLEGAAQAGAGLSVLGGSFARMSNPLSLLYGGFQDVERLNDMMINMTKDLAYWDSKRGELRISAIDQQRIKAASQQTGVSADDLRNMALRQAEREMVNKQMGSSIFDEDTREYIRNLAHIDEKGRAYIRFAGEDRNTYISELTNSQKDKLRRESEAMSLKDTANIGDIYVQTKSMQDKLNDWVNWFKSKFFEVILKIANWVGSWGRSRRDKDMQEIRAEQNKIKEQEAKAKNTDPSQISNNVQGHARGGYITGPGTSTSDDILARLSNGEFVMNAKATSAHFGELQTWNAEGNAGIISAGQNQLNSIKVSTPSVSTPSVNTPVVSRIEPLDINISGKLDLTLNGQATGKSISHEDLLKPEVIRQIARELERNISYGIDPSKTQQKYLY